MPAIDIFASGVHFDAPTTVANRFALSRPHTFPENDGAAPAVEATDAATAAITAVAAASLAGSSRFTAFELTDIPCTLASMGQVSVTVTSADVV